MNPQASSITNPRLASRTTGGLKPGTISGLVLIPVGAWAALAPFLVGDWALEWHFGRFLLLALPGIAAVLGGLILLSGRRGLVSIGGASALAAGLWLIVGPAVYALAAGADLGTTPGGESVRLLQWMPFLFGAGALISLVSSYGLGLLVPLRFGDDTSAGSEPPVQTAPPVETTPSAESAPGPAEAPLAPDPARRSRPARERPAPRRDRPRTPAAPAKGLARRDT